MNVTPASVLRWMTKPVAVAALFVHDRLIWLADHVVAARPDGAAGGCVLDATSRAPAQSAWSKSITPATVLVTTSVSCCTPATLTLTWPTALAPVAAPLSYSTVP